MTRKDFESIYWLRKNIRRWEHKLEELDLSSGIKSASNYSAAPAYGTNATSDKVGQSAQRRAEYSDTIKRLMNAAEHKAEEIYRYIEQINVDEPYIAAVIEERCINCRRWEEVADVLGGSGEAHKKAYYRFMDKNFKADENCPTCPADLW